MSEVKIIQAPFNSETAAVDLYSPEIDGLIWNKGLEVIHERALICPCKNKTVGTQTQCRNCLGSGYVFINPEKTKMIVLSINRDTRFKEWSQENLGKVGITALANAEISFMDRITISNGLSTFNEALYSFSNLYNDKIVFYAIYEPIDISHCFLFYSTNSKLIPLKLNRDFTINKHWIFLDKKFLPQNTTLELDPLTITIRYKHRPRFHVLDLTRDILVSTITQGRQDEEQTYPLHAIGRRSHYVLNSPNITETDLIDNTEVVY